MEAALATIDELSADVGLTVRTTRYYASLGLIPPPIRKGRVAYYDDRHRSRLQLVRALQDHGFTLQAIEGFLAEIPTDATVEELALQRAMLTSWTARGPELITHEQLEERAGRTLGEVEIDRLERIAALERRGHGYLALPGLSVGLGLLDVDVPAESLSLAEEAISRHMGALADELTDILRSQVVVPYRKESHSPEDALKLEQTMAKLRQFTLEAVVHGFQRAANAVIMRSLGRSEASTPTSRSTP